MCYMYVPMYVYTLLQDACRVVKEFMERDEGEMRFTITALAAAGEAYD